MLYSFTIENFGCFKSKVKLDFEAAAIKEDEHLNNSLSDFKEWKTSVLPAALIYGKNASGKSTVINALDAVMLHLRVPNQEISRRLGLGILSRPFEFDLNSRTKPSAFEMVTIFSNEQYRYYIEIFENKVAKEILEYKAKGKKKFRTLFSRKIGSADLKPAKEMKELSGFINKVAENQLVLPLVFQSFDVSILENFKKWIKDYAVGKGTEDYFYEGILGAMVSTDDTGEITKSLVKFINAFDISVSDIKAKKNSNDTFEIIFYRNCKNKKYQLDSQYESFGTMKLAKIFFPIYFCLKFGGLVVLDEVSNGLHPKVTQTILRLFENSKINVGNGQIVAATHESYLLDNKILRRDQIWFSHKADDLSANLVSLVDFSPRKDLNLENAFLDNRFDTTPYIDEDALEQVFKKLGANLEMKNG